MIAARVPIYWTKDAGRGFWLKLKTVVLDKGYKANQILPTMFTLVKENKVVAVCQVTWTICYTAVFQEQNKK